MLTEKQKNIKINNEIREYINSGLSYYEISKIFKISRVAIKRRCQRMGIYQKCKPYYENKSNKENKSIINSLDRDIALINIKKTNKENNDKLQEAISRIKTLETELSTFKSLKDISDFNICPYNTINGELVAVAVASDWHYWETVNPEQVNFINEYNKNIAQNRANAFFYNIKKLVDNFNNHSQIHTLVLALLGDFISGNIHDELLEGNQGCVIDEIMAVQDMLCSGIKFILENTNLNLIIPCHSGNHGRITGKRRVATEAGNSLEYYMYHNIAKYFANNNRVEFRISRGYLSYLDIKGFIIRFHHGHSIKYGGGVGGIFIPTFKAIPKWDKLINANLTVFAHFHQIKDGGIFLTNGSLVGYNDFAISIKADYERPQQLFFLIDTVRKQKTVTTPIFVD
jgi:hypothetical protein